MDDREVLEWWDYLSCRAFVFGPVKDIAELDEMLNPMGSRRIRQRHKPAPTQETPN